MRRAVADGTRPGQSAERNPLRLVLPAQIRELDELRKQGLLTEAEFAAKKRQLLDRM